MTRRRQALGRDGEERAARHLEARGYRIVARNVRAERVEIDLIARRGPVLAFVEVKSRRAGRSESSGGHGLAAEAVDIRKQQRLRRGAAAWLAAHPEQRVGTRRVRFDVVTCLLRPAGHHSAGTTVEGRGRARNDDTAPGERARWSVEHWEAAF